MTRFKKVFLDKSVFSRFRRSSSEAHRTFFDFSTTASSNSALRFITARRRFRLIVIPINIGFLRGARGQEHVCVRSTSPHLSSSRDFRLYHFAGTAISHRFCNLTGYHRVVRIFTRRIIAQRILGKPLEVFLLPRITKT